ncbi:uncharacterized protein BcabD6B2_06130 [Babesia caballi]|uniref:Uncharacterized protein n=1 Tax=Babesia caballi TaxID=5871 RepID=A0AAV4LMV5_BABCB|nr:hypothetical protein, conserved [Babesia caballi]
MNTETQLLPRKRPGRRYQFEPQSVSATFPLVAERVRELVRRDRADLKEAHVESRAARRALFRRLSQAESAFVPPQSLDEIETRAAGLNDQLAILKETERTLQSLLTVVENARRKVANDPPRSFTTEPSASREELEAEQAEERAVLDAMREQRKAAFLAELMERSQAELRRRKQESDRQVRLKWVRDMEERVEENQSLLASDRKLVASGIYRNHQRPHMP